MKTNEVGLFDAKTRLSEIIQSVQKGEVFYITKRGLRVAELKPIAPEKAPLTKGCAACDGYWMAPDFDEMPGDFEEYSK